jgi:hypothetical protein
MLPTNFNRNYYIVSGFIENIRIFFNLLSLKYNNGVGENVIVTNSKRN